jgi:hypothetical protein
LFCFHSCVCFCPCPCFFSYCPLCSFHHY